MGFLLKLWIVWPDASALEPPFVSAAAKLLYSGHDRQ
jgi:hypothetical protein